MSKYENLDIKMILSSFSKTKMGNSRENTFLPCSFIYSQIASFFFFFFQIASFQIKTTYSKTLPFSPRSIRNYSDGCLAQKMLTFLGTGQ